MNSHFDLVVVGGGILGATAALQARAGGMRVLVLEQSELGSGASGANAGTLSLQIKRVDLMPYALKGHHWWARTGAAVGFKRTGGVTLAFTEPEASLLIERMTLKRQAGAPIDIISLRRLRELEPGISTRVLAASWCPEDGFANSSLTGRYLRSLLRAAGVVAREHSRVTAIERVACGYVVAAAGERHVAPRLLLATGAWLKDCASMLGIDLPVRVRVNTVSVTERAAPTVRRVVGHATGLLTLKQKPDGTILIGGGWQGRGTPAEGPGEVVIETLVNNLQLAHYAVPALSGLRLTRSWTGFEANVPDFFPLAGALPGASGAFVVGCVRGGYTIGPYLGRLMGDLILGRQPEMPLFDPGRFHVSALQRASSGGAYVG